MPDTQRESWVAISTDLAMANYGASQTWTAVEDYTLTEVWLRMANSVPAYTGTLTLDLYTVTANEPDTKIATLGTADCSLWGSLFGFRIFTGISQAITNGVQYAYVVNLNPLRDGTHYIRWSGKSGYTGGIGYQENTDEVYTNAGIDWHFVNYGTSASVPSKPTNPDPADNAIDVDFSNLTLSWNDGGGADDYDIYVGDAVGNLTLIESGRTQTSKVLTDTQRDALFTDHCYWRIDASNAQGTTTGDVWDFTVAAPGKAQNPTPLDNAEDIIVTGISRITQLSWVAPS